MSEFVYPFATQSGYGTGPGDEAAIERLAAAVEDTEIVLAYEPFEGYGIPSVGAEQIATDVVVNIDDWR